MIFVQKLLYGLSAKISEMRGSVAEKRVELDRLRQLRSLSTILELQVSSFFSFYVIHSNCFSIYVILCLKTMSDNGFWSRNIRYIACCLKLVSSVKIL